jgi:hypothetical protein
MIVNDLSAEEQHSLETPLITREFVPQEFSTTERNFDRTCYLLNLINHS